MSHIERGSQLLKGKEEDPAEEEELRTEGKHGGGSRIEEFPELPEGQDGGGPLYRLLPKDLPKQEARADAVGEDRGAVVQSYALCRQRRTATGLSYYHLSGGEALCVLTPF
jgi:hypothetical protein